MADPPPPGYNAAAGLPQQQPAYPAAPQQQQYPPAPQQQPAAAPQYPPGEYKPVANPPQQQPAYPAQQPQQPAAYPAQQPQQHAAYPAQQPSGYPPQQQAYPGPPPQQAYPAQQQPMVLQPGQAYPGQPQYVGAPQQTVVVTSTRAQAPYVNGSYRHIPILPMWLAILMLLLNVLTSGWGTIIGGLCVLCCGHTYHVSIAPGEVACISVLYGFLQLLFAFWIFGWIWAIVWGVFFVTASSSLYGKQISDQTQTSTIVVAQ